MVKPSNASLETVYSLWMVGEWEELADLAKHIDKKNPDYKNIILYIFSGQLQVIKKEDGIEALDLIRSKIEEIISLEIDVDKVKSIMISGIKNSLGRAFAINGNINEAKNKFAEALAFSRDFKPSKSILNTRSQTQVLCLSKQSKELNYLGANLVLESAKCDYPNQVGFEIALAENAYQNKKNTDAIRHWQNAASLMQDAMPQTYYDRLSQAYLEQRSFPQGTVEEEFLKGSIDKYEVLKHLHKNLKPKKYFEIGVQTGKSLLLADCEAIGVDPMPYPNIKLKSNHRILRMTSDEFFVSQADKYLEDPPDLVFIDGMHFFEFALRDFLNVERFVSKNTVVVIDDIFPCHPAQAERERRTRAWTGDVWKLIEIVEKYRKDLKIYKIDAYPTGIACISNFSQSCSDVDLVAMDFIAEIKSKRIVPTDVIDRVGSIRLEQFFEIFRK